MGDAVVIFCFVFGDRLGCTKFKCGLTHLKSQGWITVVVLWYLDGSNHRSWFRYVEKELLSPKQRTVQCGKRFQGVDRFHAGAMGRK
ncbi:hypothetical protein JTE90_018646 [Oedothorax gibbosus]|uniref:Uncharacterized protein n=1 Tax=Oedothorax gibbosus TaxID=931172 RepID=A0AAV6TKJ7_9ARAC|nr:hypothetical protein JTE90_018646 [Oedothorax gibbosus]